MNLSVFYARVLGFYLVIMSVGMFIKPQPLLLLMTQNNQIILTALGIFTLILGLTMVMSHQIWRGWPIIITILGYWAIVKGIVIIFYPDLVFKISTIVLQGTTLVIGLGFDLVLGLILIFCGFKLRSE